MKKYFHILLAAVASSLLGAGASQAYDWSVTAQVTIVEGSYLPNFLAFQINQAAGSCAAGGWLIWTPTFTDVPSKAASTAAVLSLVMTAQTTSQNITIFGNNSGCAVQFIHLGNS